MNFLIKNITVKKTKEINSFEIRDINLILGTRAEIYVYLKNGNDIVFGEQIMLDGLDYNMWNSDDNFVVKFIKNYLYDKYSIKI